MSTRPSRNASPPLANALHCRTCGRVISPRRSHTQQPTPQKYCSDRCRREKPRPDHSIEADIEMAFVRLLGDGRERRIVKCEEVEREIFSMTRRHTVEEEQVGSAGPQDADGKGAEGQSSDEEEPEDEDGGVRLPSHMDHPTTTTVEPKLEKRPHPSPRDWGMQRAKEREMVRRAARRGVAFGFEIDEGRRRSVEAVQWGRHVESSFAKGEWGVRWRD